MCTFVPTSRRCFRLNKVCRPLTTKPKKRGRKPKNGIKEEGDEEAASVATWGDSSRASIAPGFSLAPVATAGGSSPLLDLVIDRANPRCFNEMYLQVSQAGRWAGRQRRPSARSISRARDSRPPHLSAHIRSINPRTGIFLPLQLRTAGPGPHRRARVSGRLPDSRARSRSRLFSSLSNELGPRVGPTMCC